MLIYSGANYHFWVINDHFGGPSGQILQKKAGKGQSLPPFLAMPGFWVHMVPQLIPKLENVLRDQSLSSKPRSKRDPSTVLLGDHHGQYEHYHDIFFFFQSHLSGSKPLIDEALVHLFLNLLSQALQIRN